MSYVGVAHGVPHGVQHLFFAHVHLHGGPAPVHRYLPRLIDLLVRIAMVGLMARRLAR